MTSAERLGINSEDLWAKVRHVVLQESLVHAPEERALQLVQRRGRFALNQQEKAYLILAGIDHLMSCAKGKRHEYPLLGR